MQIDDVRYLLGEDVEKTIKLKESSVGKTFLCRDHQYYAVIESFKESNGNSDVVAPFFGKLMRVKDNVQEGDMAWTSTGLASVNKTGNNFNWVGHFDLVDEYDTANRDMTAPPALTTRVTDSGSKHGNKI